MRGETFIVMWSLWNGRVSGEYLGISENSVIREVILGVAAF
jgi:hypothetical protein